MTQLIVDNLFTNGSTIDVDFILQTSSAGQIVHLHAANEIESSFNFSSVTDVSSGVWAWNPVNAYADAEYFLEHMSQAAGGGIPLCLIYEAAATLTTTYGRMQTYRETGSRAYADTTMQTLQVLGDLA